MISSLTASVRGRILCTVALALAVCVACAAGAVRADETEIDKNDFAYEEMERLTEVMLHVRKHYVDEKTYKDIISGAMQGMLRSLDPHSAFLPPRAYEDVQDDTYGKYGGIGIVINIRDNILTIISPIEGTPGFRAGLLSGDKIVEIDGESTTGITLRESVNKLRGAKGSKVVLTVRSRHEDKAREVEIVRDDIEVPSVKSAKILDGGIGYIRITQFSVPTAESFQKDLDGLLQGGMKALVLDLRGNPGGLLNAAVEVADKFLEKGQVIVTTKGREGSMGVLDRRAIGDVHYLDFPMAVLVNGGTASASEIVAGALQDHSRAVIIGDTTYGKGSVQSVIQLKCDGESAIRLTTARYYTPSGRGIHDKGLEPDIPVYVPPEEWRDVQIKRAQDENAGYFSEEETEKYAGAVDRQLQRAVDLLQAIMIFQGEDS